MTTKQLREWLFLNGLEDQWWLSIDKVTGDSPVTLSEVESCLQQGGQALVIHVSQATLANPPWIEVEGGAHFPASNNSTLTTCLGCGARISALAEVCPQCAHPMGGGTTQARGGKIQTIEKTSKANKLQNLLSTLLLLTCFIVLLFSSGIMGNVPDAAATGIGAVGFVIGLIWFIWGRFTAWWHHG